MIYLSLKGGLGNQMFQYAAARSMAIDTNEEITLDLKNLNNSKVNHEIYTLDKLNINSNIKLSNEKINFTIKQNIIYKIIILGIFFRLSYKNKQLNDYFEKTFQKILNKNGFYQVTSGYIPIKVYNTKIKYFNGYFQSDKYFKKNFNIIREELLVKEKVTKKNKVILDKIKSTESVCVHIRRGDYTNLENYLICNISYYLKAIEIMKEKIKNPKFYIFSDDIEWVKKNINFNANVTYIDKKNTNYEELRLMYNCKHFIISNSSFSWWAQYLSANENKIVISPNIWYKDQKQPQDMILDYFTTIDVSKLN